MKTGVIYCRYSSDSQTEQSIEEQLRVCNEYAKSNNIVILDTYIDRAMTGTNDNRPDFQRMIKDSAKKSFDVVLVYKFDRFSRNKYETAIHKKTLKDNGVKVISAMEYIPDSPEAIILESMLEGYAEYYSAELSQKVKRGMRETRSKGNFTGGFIIYGYKVENHKVVIDEEKAETVKYIFEQYAIGVYVKDIIKALTAKGIYNRGKPFARNTVYNILKNEKYAGIYRYNGEVFTNIYPQIVPQETYDIVRNKIDSNHYGKRSTEVVYLLRHKMKCGYCGSPVSAECGTAKNGERKRYYKCLGRKNGNGCKKSQARKEVLENYVLENIIMQLSNNMDYIVSELMTMQENYIKSNSALTRLFKEQRSTENSINNIMTAIENGGTSNTAMKRLRELEEKNAELEKQIRIEQSHTAFKLDRKEITDFYKFALEQEPKMLINLLVKEIRLFDDKMIIVYNAPRTISLDESQGFSFYTDNVPYPIYIQNVQEPRMIDFQLIMRI